MTPVYRIFANGNDITESLMQRTAAIEISDSAGTNSDSLTITCSRRDLKLPPTGAELNVKFGFRGGGIAGDLLWDMGIFVVDEIEVGHSTLQISAKAASFSRSGGLKNTLKSQVNRSWDRITLGDIVHTIARKHGYKPRISQEFAGQLIDHIDQTDESDLHFLIRLAKQYGVTAKPVAGYLVFVRRGRSASGKELPATTIRSDEINPGWRVTIKDRGKFASAKARWYDRFGAEAQWATAGSGEPVRTLGGQFASEVEAQKAAEAELERLNRGRQELTFTMSGRPLFAESPVKIDLGDPIVAESWLISQATHSMSSSGYTLSVTAEAAK